MINLLLVTVLGVQDPHKTMNDRGAAPPCQRVRALVGERLEQLDQRLAELTALRHGMQRLLRDWDRP